MILEVAVSVFVDVRVVQPDFVVFHARKGVSNLAFAGAQGLDFGSAQDDAGLEGFKDMIIAARFGIGHDVGHKQNQPEGRPSGWEIRWRKESASLASLG